MARWEDITAYAPSERSKRVPRAWELRASWLRLVVHRLHGAGERAWYGSCHAIGIKDVELGRDPERAKGLLNTMVRDKLHTAYSALARFR